MGEGSGYLMEPDEMRKGDCVATVKSITFIPPYNSELSSSLLSSARMVFFAPLCISTLCFGFELGFFNGCRICAGERACAEVTEWRVDDALCCSPGCGECAG